MYDRMVSEHGYSIRKLADKLGKDKGYVENRLRLADAPDEIRELVSLRKDTLSHAYELMKVEDPKRRRRLADQVARGELTLIKLRDKIEGRRTRAPRSLQDVDGSNEPLDLELDLEPPTETDDAPDIDEPEAVPAEPMSEADEDVTTVLPRRPLSEDSLVNAKASLNEALDQLSDVFDAPQVLSDMRESDRQNLAKYLTISKLRLENAIIKVRNTH